MSGCHLAKVKLIYDSVKKKKRAHRAARRRGWGGSNVQGPWCEACGFNVSCSWSRCDSAGVFFLFVLYGSVLCSGDFIMCFSLKPDLDLCGAGSGQQPCRTLPCAPRCNVSASVTATAGRVSVTRLAWSIAVENFGSEYEICSCKELGDLGLHLRSCSQSHDLSSLCVGNWKQSCEVDWMSLVSFTFK